MPLDETDPADETGLAVETGPDEAPGVPEGEAQVEEGDGDEETDLAEEEFDEAEAADRVGRIHQVSAVASLVLSGVSILGSLFVVTVLRRGLAADPPDPSALLGQVNPWYVAAIGTFLAALILLVAWGVLNLKRSPVGQRGPGVVPAGVGLAFAALAWAFSFYRKIP